MCTCKILSHSIAKWCQNSWYLQNKAEKSDSSALQESEKKVHLWKYDTHNNGDTVVHLKYLILAFQQVLY